MGFVLNSGTVIKNPYTEKPIENGVKILQRDIERVFGGSKGDNNNEIILKKRDHFEAEAFEIHIEEKTAVIHAGDELGFVYGLLYISEKFLGIKPFWFWLDQRIEKKESIEIPEGAYISEPFAVRYRGWFFNDEVLLLKWDTDIDKEEIWRMAFEALLRCGGNITIPGTDKTSRENRSLASEMGLWITHHHAEPLGAEMFARAYPDKNPSFAENEELFRELWEKAVQEQKDYNVIWNLCFRGQGDQPFWSHDAECDTPEKRGKVISDLIKVQCGIVKKYVKNPVFCTNLYGEIMELYKDGYIDIDQEVIKVRADNGYGRMVTRRRDNHSARVEAMPEKGGGKQGIYYHVSFYDLQAANHITPMPNSIEFVNDELNRVMENDGNDFWIINCSNVRPHVYALDAVRKKWSGQNISDLSHSREFAWDYYGREDAAAECLEEYPKAAAAYGKEADEHAGEQFYTENVRIMAHRIVSDPKNTEPVSAFRWIAGESGFIEQIKHIRKICGDGYDGITEYFNKCGSAEISEEYRKLFDATLFLYAKIHYYCCGGMITFINAIEKYFDKEYKEAFVLAGDAAVMFDKAQQEMRGSEYGVWKGFYFNDCFADIKHSAYMIKKAMGTIREMGDNARHDKWYRETVYPVEDRKVMLLLVLDNHMTDWELYEAMKKDIDKTDKEDKL